MTTFQNRLKNKIKATNLRSCYLQAPVMLQGLFCQDQQLINHKESNHLKAVWKGGNYQQNSHGKIRWHEEI